jgi:hypothetical protein
MSDVVFIDFTIDYQLHLLERGKLPLNAPFLTQAQQEMVILSDMSGNVLHTYQRATREVKKQVLQDHINSMKERIAHLENLIRDPAQPVQEKPYVYIAMSSPDNDKLHMPFESIAQAEAYFQKLGQHMNVYLFAYRINTPVREDDVPFKWEKCYQLTRNGFQFMEHATVRTVTIPK